MLHKRQYLAPQKLPLPIAQPPVLDLRPSLSINYPRNLGLLSKGWEPPPMRTCYPSKLIEARKGFMRPEYRVIVLRNTKGELEKLFSG